jgi:hypothetical protein
VLVPDYSMLLIRMSAAGGFQPELHDLPTDKGVRVTWFCVTAGLLPRGTMASWASRRFLLRAPHGRARSVIGALTRPIMVVRKPYGVPF